MDASQQMRMLVPTLLHDSGILEDGFDFDPFLKGEPLSL